MRPHFGVTTIPNGSTFGSNRPGTAQNDFCCGHGRAGAARPYVVCRLRVSTAPLRASHGLDAVGVALLISSTANAECA